MARETKHIVRMLASLVAVPLVLAGCREEPEASDDDTDGPGASHCEDGTLLDPDLPAAFDDEFPDGCVPAECGVGPWGALDLGEGVVFVDGRAAEGGDGTEATPLRSIQVALGQAPAEGGKVAVAAGIYEENLVLPPNANGLLLAGRCRDLVILDASQGEDDEPGIRAEGKTGAEQWSISGVTVSQAPYVGLAILNGQVNADAIRLDQNRWIGIYVGGPTSMLTLTNSEITSTQPAPDGTFGRGINVQGGARLEASSCSVENNTDVGIQVGDAETQAVLQGVHVRGTMPLSGGTRGRGINVQAGALLTATDCAVEDNSEVGIFVSDGGTDVLLEDVEVRSTLAPAEGAAGHGVEVGYGARLVVSSSVVEGNTGAGILVSNEGTDVLLQDVEVRDTLPLADGTDGIGILVQRGGRLEAASCVVANNSEVGVHATGEETEVVLDDVEVRDTQPEADGTDGRGIEAVEGARLEVSNSLVAGNKEVGVLAGNEGTQVVLQFVEIQDTEPLPDGTGGRGIVVQDHAHLDASSCTLERNAELGIFAAGESTEVHLQSVDVWDTLPRPDGTGGRGIAVQQGARLEAATCSLQGNHEVGIFADSEGTELLLEEVDVLDTAPSPSGLGGRGFNVQDGARIEAFSCSLEGNTDLGIFATGEHSVVLLHDVTVTGTMALPDGTFGRGISVHGGAHLEASSSVVSSSAELGIGVGDPGTEVILRDVVVQVTRRSDPMAVGIGLGVQQQATVQATDLTVTQTEGLGVYVNSDATFVGSSCDLSENAFAGALVWNGGLLDLSNSTIRSTVHDANEGGGFGIFASGRYGPSTLRVDSVVIEEQPYSAVWLQGDGSYTIRNSTLVAGYGVELEYPDGTTTVQHGDAIVATAGVTAWDGASGLRLEDNEFRDAVEAGVFLDGSSAALSNNSFVGNDTDLIWQDCEGVDEPVGLADVPLVDHCPTYNHHVAPVEFNLYMEDGQPLDWSPDDQLD